MYTSVLDAADRACDEYHAALDWNREAVVRANAMTQPDCICDRTIASFVGQTPPGQAAGSRMRR